MMRQKRGLRMTIMRRRRSRRKRRTKKHMDMLTDFNAMKQVERMSMK